MNLEFEAFVHAGIALQKPFALETTLRSNVTFEQARMARSAGFRPRMTYVALDNFKLHLERVIRRANAGGHAASETTLRKINDSSMANLAVAVSPESGIDVVRIFDNSAFDKLPRLLLQTAAGRVVWIATDVPSWLRNALHWSDSDIATIRADLAIPKHATS